MNQPVPAEALEYPPLAYAAGASTKEQPAATKRWKWLVFPALSGFAVGALWWLLAPGGGLYGSGEEYLDWIARDLTLGAVGVACAILLSAMLLFASRKTRQWDRGRFLALLLGSVLGSVIAWQVGVILGQIFQPRPADLPIESILFSLRTYSVLLLWPLAVALISAMAAFFSLMFAPDRG